MGREIKLVPLNFDWPLGTVWAGYLMPSHLRGRQCDECDGSGSSPYARRLQDRWYGNAPFDPAEEGSTSLTPETPAVRDLAEHNVRSSPHFYVGGRRLVPTDFPEPTVEDILEWADSEEFFRAAAPFGENRTWLRQVRALMALVEHSNTPPQERDNALEKLTSKVYEGPIRREAQRLAAMWNEGWNHHLSQEDVDALVAGGSLYDFTHTWSGETGWQPKDPPYHPTAAEVNTWSLRGFGHDSINCLVVVKARCLRDGFPYLCAWCHGHGDVEMYEGQRADAEAWRPEEPPSGDGWQLWETVPEGSPISPVFPLKEGLIHWLMSPAYTRSASEPLTREQAVAFVDAAWAPSLVVTAEGRVLTGEQSSTPKPGELEAAPKALETGTVA